MKEEELKKIAVLQGLDDAALARLAEKLDERQCADGELIFAEGEPGDAMFFICSGSVRIEKRTGADALSRKTLAVIECGDYFGEMSLFDDKPRSASAMAAGATRLLRFSREAFQTLPKQGSAAGMSVLFGMIRNSGERIRRLNTQIIVYDEIGKAIGESKTLEELLGVVLSQLCRATLADWGMVTLRAQFCESIELRSTVNLTLTPSQRDTLENGETFWRRLTCEPQERLVPDMAQEEPFRSEQGLGFETPALLLAAIRIESQALGLIALGARPAGHFDANDLNLARGVARQAAQAILNARHLQESAARARHAKQFVRF